MAKLWRVAAALALVTVSCRAEANALVDVEQDGSGHFTVEIGADEQLLSLVGGAESFVDSIGELDLTNLDALDQRVDGDMTFYSLTRPFDDVSELEDIIREQAGQDGGTAFEQFDITIDEEGASIIARASSPLPDDAGAGPGVDVDAIQQALTANVYVTLPGRVVEDNADENMDGTLRWSIDLRDGVDIMAATVFAEEGFPWLLMLLAAAGVAILGALGFAVARRRAAAPLNALAGTEAPPPPGDFGQPEG